MTTQQTLNLLAWVPTANNSGLHELLIRLAKSDAQVLMSDGEGPHLINVSVVPQEYVEEWKAQDEAIPLAEWLEYQCENLLFWMDEATEDKLHMEVFFDGISDLGNIDHLLDETGVTVSVPFSRSALRNHCAVTSANRV